MFSGHGSRHCLPGNLSKSGTKCAPERVYPQDRAFAATISSLVNIKLNPNPRIEQQPITDGRHCLIIDDFLLNPEDVLAYAQAHTAEFEMSERAYPGLVLPLAERPVRALHHFWRSRLSRIFSFARSDINDDWQLSLTTLQPKDFTWIQRLCHSDPRTEDGRENFAALVYLFHNPELGGTAFYRWRDEKFWPSMVARQLHDPNAGLSIVQTRYPMFLDPPCYMTESNEVAELLTMVPAKFNRMICYPGDIPHSAYITDPSLLTDDCSTGRLTLNCFASVWPKPR